MSGIVAGSLSWRIAQALLLSLGLFFVASVQAKEAALVTSVGPGVTRQGQPVESFVKLHVGDTLDLPAGGAIKLVFFLARREEAWKGGGQLRITGAGGASSNLPEPAAREIPESVVRQISKTPALDTQGRAGAMRLRTLGTAEAVVKLEGEYRQMRNDAAADDANPELYLLSGLYEMQAYDRLDAYLGEIEGRSGGGSPLKELLSRYRRLADASREAK